jgi:hypothetical protein
MDEMISLKERRSPWFKLTPHRLDTGTYATYTIFKRKLYGQQWVKLRYDIMQKDQQNFNIYRKTF